MSEQIFLQGKLLGLEEFLTAAAGGTGPESEAERICGRFHWISLLGEVLPRALLAEMSLARVLLGSSGGGQFLLVLPGEVQQRAEEFLAGAAWHALALSQGRVKLLWSVTENLGDWTAVRKRLTEQLHALRNTPLAGADDAVFAPFDPPSDPASEADRYFSEQLGRKVREAAQVGWSPEAPAAVSLEGGKYTWGLSSNLSADGITLARHAALTEDGAAAAALGTLARRARGRPLWGVLRGDVDHFGIRLRRLQTIEDHVRLSVLYKQFFAGELEVLCSMPEFWRKITILYSGGDDFAVYGSWDALIELAAELQRLFHRFTEENLQDFPGAEGKTIAMAIALATDPERTLGGVYEEAGRNLQLAKSADKDCIYLLDRVLEWRQLAGAGEMKDTVLRMLEEFRGSRQFLDQLRGFYQKELAGGGRDSEGVLNRLGRFQRRHHRALGGSREREFEKLRAHLVNEIVGRKTAAGKPAKLRPAGGVALEWARLATEG